MKPKVHSRNRLHALLRVLLACGIMGLAVLPAAYAQSLVFNYQEPLVFNYQGFLANADGTPVSDGIYTFQTSVESCSEGTVFWSETNDVTTRNGVFNIRLGLKTPMVPSMLLGYVGWFLTINGEPLVSEDLCAIDNVPAGTLLIPYFSVDVGFSGDGTPENPLGLADGSVTGVKLADGAIVGDGNILVSRQNDGSVMVECCSSEGFTAVHIEADLEGDGTPENPLRVADGGITEEKLADGSVTGLKIAAGAIVGGENILVSRQNDGSFVMSADDRLSVSFEAFTGDGTPENPLGLADGGVSSEKLADESVTSAKLAEGSVTASKLAEESVTASKLDDRVIKAGDGIQVTRTNTGTFEIAIKRGAAFRVNQLLDAENLPLLPGIVASPEPTAVYNGNVLLDARGEAVVVLPESFAALSDEVRYQLTCLGGFAPVYVAEEIAANRFSIAGGTPGMKVSWQVTAVR